MVHPGQNNSDSFPDKLRETTMAVFLKKIFLNEQPFEVEVKSGV